MRRFLAWIFLIAALAAFGYDLYDGPLNGQDLEIVSLAERWAELHRASLIGLNSFTEKSLSPGLWDTVMLPALSFPAVAVFSGLALFFFFASLFKRRRSWDI